MFMTEQNYQGYLLASHPKRQESALHKSVVLILEHGPTGATGLQLNKSYVSEITLATVMQNVGLHSSFDQPLYNGGPEAKTRIHVVHSLDWYSPTTVRVSENIGVSNDVSVLAAISENVGPEYYRVIAGFTRWLPGHLEGEMVGEDPWDISHTWSYVPSEVDTLFELDNIEQWHRVIAESGRMQVSSWF